MTRLAYTRPRSLVVRRILEHRAEEVVVESGPFLAFVVDDLEVRSPGIVAAALLDQHAAQRDQRPVLVDALKLANYPPVEGLRACCVAGIPLDVCETQQPLRRPFSFVVIAQPLERGCGLADVSLSVQKLREVE